MSLDVAEKRPTGGGVLLLSRAGISVRDDDGVGVRLLVGFCDALDATTRAKGMVKGLREWLRLAGPYTFTPLAGNRLLPLNRDYKPLGISPCQGPALTDLPWVVYEDYEALAVPAARLDLTQAYRIYPDRSGGHCREYLYQDINSPWKDRKCLEAYLGRLVRMVEARP